MRLGSAEKVGGIGYFRAAMLYYSDNKDDFILPQISCGNAHILSYSGTNFWAYAWLRKMRETEADIFECCAFWASGEEKEKESTALRIPRRSPIQVLTQPEAA